MDASGEVADLMVKESIQLTEESIKLLAAGCKNLTAFLYALAKDNKKLVGKTSMKRLLRDEKELKTFCIKAEDLEDFRKYAKPNILFAAIRDTKKDDGLVALVTNTDFVSQVNLFMQRRGYRVFREVCAPQVSFEFFYHSERPPFTMILYRVPFTTL